MFLQGEVFKVQVQPHGETQKLKENDSGDGDGNVDERKQAGHFVASAIRKSRVNMKKCLTLTNLTLSPQQLHQQQVLGPIWKWLRLAKKRTSGWRRRKRRLGRLWRRVSTRNGSTQTRTQLRTGSSALSSVAEMSPQ